MVSGLGQDELGDQLAIRHLPANKSQSSISIPTSYQYYNYPGSSSGDGSGGYFPGGPANISSFVPTAGNRGTLPQSSRSSRTIGPGYYQRTLSSSSLLTNKSSVAKSRSDYCAIGRGPFTTSGGGDGGGGKFESIRGGEGFYHHPISGSSSNIVYVDNSESQQQSFINHHGRGESSGGGSSSNSREREYRNREQRRLIRESSQPIIINVPITAPKATATTISRATSPPQFSIKITSPKKSVESGSGNSRGQGKGQPRSRYHEGGSLLPKKYDNLETTSIGGCCTEDSATTDTEGQDEMESIEDPRGNLQNENATKIDMERVSHHRHQKEDHRLLIDPKAKAIPSHLIKYCQNAPLTKIKHPLEENIFSSLFVTLLAVAVALVIGFPVLCFALGLIVCVVFIRYSLSLLHGCCSYLRFICSNRHQPSARMNPPEILPRDRLAFANDVRWLGKKKPKQCQSILHTILVFEGKVDVAIMRHLIQTRVLHAETHKGELAYPRLLQKLVALPAGYKWELDVTFDIQNHIFAGPSHIRNEAQVQEYLGLLFIENLPLGKPLWEIRVITNYGTQKDTVAILRVHQCLADGMTLVRILSHSLADQAQMHIPQRPHFAGLSFGFNVIRSVIVGPLTFFMWLFTSFRDRNLFSIPLGKRKNFRKKMLNNPNNANSTGGSRLDKIKRGFISSVIGGSGGQSSGESNNSSYQTTINKSGGGNKGYEESPSLGGGSRGECDSNNDQQHHHQEQMSYERPTLKDSSVSTRSPLPNKKQLPRKVANWKKTNKSKLEGSLKKKRRCPVWNVVWSAPVSVPKVARVKQIMRSSLNDVLLSAATGSVRLYLQKLGIPCPDDVKVVIPVDLRNDVASPKTSTKLGCKVANLLTTVPSGVESAIPRLWAIRHRLDELKASADPVVAYGATTVLMNLLPHRLGVSILDSILDKASLQFCNLPGPTHTTVVGGYPLKGIYPIYPPGGKIRVAITVFTYADQVHVTVVAHRSLYNAAPSLLQGLTGQVDQLSRQLSQRRVPGESRRSARNASMNSSEITKPPTRQIHMQLQVVQEELQQLSHRLDSRTQDVTMGHGPSPPVPVPSGSISSDDFRSSDESLVESCAGVSSLSPSGQAQLRTRLKTLKTEFSELIGELRRRSSIVEGVAMSFEDEEQEEEFRKPRKRALSVVSMSRRNSLFASRSMTTPDSSVCYSSDEELPSSPSHDIRMYNPSSNIRHTSSPIRTTAV